MRWTTLGRALLAACTMTAGSAVIGKDDGCGTRFVCGIKDPEDLVAVPNTPWVIAGSFPRPGSGDLYLVDSRTLSARPLRAAASISEKRDPAYECAGPPDATRFVAHGVALSPIDKHRSRLFVVNHGGREAIEVFQIDASGAAPTVRWTGCVVPPDGLEANSVVALSDGGLVFSSLYNSEDSDWKARIAKLGAGAPSGGIYEWHKGQPLRRVAAPPISGPNGVELSSDQRYLFVSGWADSTVHRIDRTGKEAPRTLKLDFLPDNVRWSPDGILLITGQRETVSNMFACALQPNRPTYCVPGWTVAALDGDKMKIVRKTSGDGRGEFGDATVALNVDDKYWLGAIAGDRIAVVPR